ncbi:hypothetical protein DFQ28_011354, partial [Apophysomyces sp. BC1034]
RRTQVWREENQARVDAQIDAWLGEDERQESERVARILGVSAEAIDPPAWLWLRGLDEDQLHYCWADKPWEHEYEDHNKQFEGHPTLDEREAEQRAVEKERDDPTHRLDKEYHYLLVPGETWWSLERNAAAAGFYRVQEYLTWRAEGVEAHHTRHTPLRDELRAHEAGPTGRILFESRVSQLAQLFSERIARQILVAGERLDCRGEIPQLRLQIGARGGHPIVGGSDHLADPVAEHRQELVGCRAQRVAHETGTPAVSQISPEEGDGELNVLKQHLQSKLFTLLEREVSQRRIHELTGVDRKTIRRYQAIFQSRWAVMANSSGVSAGLAEPVVTQIPPPQTPALPQPPALEVAETARPFNFARSASASHRDWIEQQLCLKRNAQAIYQDLVDQFGFTASYQSVKRFVRALRHVEPEQFDRLEFAPAEEAQVDYGEGALTLDPKTGRYRRPRLFVMTLRYSRRSFRRVVWKSSKQVWAQLHEEAFRYFGGTVSYVVLDNLREGVITPDLYV